MGLMPAPMDVRWALALDVIMPTLGILPGFIGAVWAVKPKKLGLLHLVVIMLCQSWIEKITIFYQNLEWKYRTRLHIFKVNVGLFYLLQWINFFFRKPSTWSFKNVSVSRYCKCGLKISGNLAPLLGVIIMVISRYRNFYIFKHNFLNKSSNALFYY